MSGYKLQHDVVSVLKYRQASYGGSQRFSENKIVQSSGCGLIAACDLFLYMHRNLQGCHCDLFTPLPSSGPVNITEYNSLINSLRHYFPLIPNYGISGFMLTLGINAFFIKHAFPYRAFWGLRSDKLWERIENMLSQDIPVIIGIGPNLSLNRQKYKTDMYTLKNEGAFIRSTKVCAHFMTLTAIDDEWLTVSSWGRKYYIRRSDYRIYVKHHSGSIFSNIVYITKNTLDWSLPK